MAWNGALEVCDGVDNDRNGSSDEGLPLFDYYIDADGDGYGDENSTPVEACGPPNQASDCYDVVMVDSYGDGWNGGSLSIFINGFMVDSGLTGGSGYQDDGEFWASDYGTTIPMLLYKPH